ncbi:MAG: PAS domain-containing protein [Lautropia sp.]|nr:PAS domain-containing protein [Lautropia sp.]
MFSESAHPWLFAVLVAAAAMLLRAALAPSIGTDLPVLIAVPAIVAAAWLGGFWPGMLATAVCAVWSMAQPLGVPPTPGAQGALQHAALVDAMLLPAALLICLLGEQLHRTRSQASRRLEAMQRLALPSQRLQAALELAAISAFDVDRDLRYVWAQKPPVGLRESDLLGRTAEEIYEPAVAAALTSARRRILQEGAACRTEIQVRRNGAIEWVDWIGGPLRDPDDRIVGVTNLAIDITDRKRSELELRRSEESQRLLVELQDAIRELTDAGEIKARITQRVGRHFRANRCAFADILTGEASVEVMRDYTQDACSIAGSHRLGPRESILMQQLLAGRTVVVADTVKGITRTGHPGTAPVPGEAWMMPGYWEAEAGGALLCVPVLHEGDLVAALSLRHNLPHRWTPDEVTLMEQIAQRTWTALQAAHAQNALRDSRDVLALALRGGRMGAWSREYGSDKAWWSRELEEIYGLDANGFSGTRQDFLDLIHPEDRARVKDALDQALDHHRDYCVEYRFRHASGEWRWMEGRGRASYRGDGRPAITYGLGIDITERKRLEEERRRLNTELAQSLRRKDEFLATLAHELRNPLAPIVTALEVLRLKAPADPQMRWSRDVIERQVRHMTRLVDDLLDVARISSGKAQLRTERIELASVVHHAVESVKSLIDSARHALSISLPPAPLMLEADPTRLSQVLANLLSNAAKYTPPGGHISLSVRQEDREVVISVSDDGIGLSAPDLERIFSMFAQVAPALDRSQGGLGIGLALSRGLVELHGGTIVATSPGQQHGSTFIVRLPLGAQAALPQPKPGRDARSEPLPQRILVVDDNLDAAASLSMLLELDGHLTATAYDGQRALELARSFEPQVILLDIGLPLLNGYEVARRIREQPWGEDITLIAVTGWGQEQDRQQAVAAGFDHHLTKPLDPSRLASLLEAAVLR